jgi:tRNA(Ile)-lysidine synthase
LDVGRADIDAYIAFHRLSYIDDPSNASTRFARNRLRHEVWPVLQAAFPEFEHVLSQAAHWAQEAADNQTTLAQMDAEHLRWSGESHIDLTVWKTWSPARAKNVLRHWVLQCTGHCPSAALLSRLHKELNQNATARVQTWLLPTGTLKQHRGRLHWLDADACRQVSKQDEKSQAFVSGVPVYIVGPGDYKIPGWQGTLKVELCAQGGLPPQALCLQAKPRQGAEQFQASQGRPPRSLKKQFQAEAIPAWLRHGPLLWRDAQLVYVPRLGIDARVQAPPLSEQWSLQWLDE